MEKQQINPKYLKIFGDSPIDNAKYFNFNAYIEAIYRIIVYPENATPLSIVINGRWGSGKTSLMKTLRKKLSDQAENPKSRKIRTVWFNAWKYSETDAMLASLVREIYDEIDRQNFFTKQGFFDRIKLGTITIYERVSTTQQITDLAKILTLGLAPDFTKWPKTPNHEKHLPFFDAFQKYLQLILNFFVVQEKNGNYDDTKGALVIFIDDLDRCPPKSIAKILESINLFFDQKGCIFIFGMDINLIAKAINSHYTDYEGFSGEDYLKKMIQLQFDLPEIRKEEIREFIENELNFDEPVRNYIDIILKGSDSNPRQIKQYINSLRFMMTLSDTIERLNIDEELLIKWSILNLIPGDFINTIKIDKDLFFRIQAYVRLGFEEYDLWEQENRTDFLRTATVEQRQKDREEFNKKLSDKRILEILKCGERSFTSANLSDYIFLSSLAPKESDYLGAVTIVAAGSQSYYFGEEIRFAGTCTASSIVYLSITCPNPNIRNRKLDQFSIETINDDVNTFLRVDVKNDNTWEYVWDTSIVSTLMDAGTYTINACEGPFAGDNLKNKVYGAVSIVLKKPFVSATASQSTIAQGDHLYITGTAQGGPKLGVQIWIFGENDFLHRTVAVNPDASFSLRLDRLETKKLGIGQYFVVVQHPMMNNEFDVYLDTDKQNVLSNFPKKGTELFSIDGPRSKKGADAAMELVQAINNPNIDDTYTKLQFLIEKPEIRIEPISDITIGDKFSISAHTNLAVGDEVLFEFSSVDPDPTKKYHEIENGVTMIVKVTKGDGGWNRLSFVIDTATFIPKKYLLSASAVNVDAKADVFFTILEK
jgi:hypothetical protein